MKCNVFKICFVSKYYYLLQCIYKTENINISSLFCRIIEELEKHFTSIIRKIRI